MTHIKPVLISIFFFQFLLYCFPLEAQTLLRDTLIEKMLHQKQYNEALNETKKRFNNRLDKKSLYIKLAECFSLVEELDSAFYYLELFKDNKKFPYFTLSNPWLKNLHTSKKWREYESQILKQYQKEFSNSDYVLAFKIIHLFNEDQFLRSKMKLLSSVDFPINEIQKEVSLGQSRVKDFLAKDGIPLCSKLDKHSCAFLGVLIAHLSYNEKIKYKQQIEELFDNNEYDPQSYAVFTDKILVEESNAQLYGTQTYEDSCGVTHFYPIIDSFKIHERRKLLNLMPLEEWSNMIGVKYEIVPFCSSK